MNYKQLCHIIDSIDKAFNYVGDADEGFSIVELDGKYNFADEQGNVLSDQ